MQRKRWLAIVASMLLGLIFVAAGLGKLLQHAEVFRIYFASYPSYLLDLLPPAFFEAIFVWLPRIELIIGLSIIISITAKLVAAFSLLLIAGFIANNSWLLSQGLEYESCGCFGMIESITQARISTVSALYLDIGMLVLVVIILLYYPGKFITVRPWFLVRG